MIDFIYGTPGAGKSLELTRIAIDSLRKGKQVYTNYPVYDTKYALETKIITREDIKKNVFEFGAVVIIDEAGSFDWFNCRDWKSFGMDDFQFFSTHRHMGIDVYLGVQDPSRIDVSLRTLGEEYFFMRKTLFPRIKRIHTYYSFEDVGKPPEMCLFEPKSRLKLYGKEFYRSYNTRFYNNRFADREEQQVKSWEYEKVKYQSPLIQAIKNLIKYAIIMAKLPKRKSLIRTIKVKWNQRRKYGYDRYDPNGGDRLDNVPEEYKEG